MTPGQNCSSKIRVLARLWQQIAVAEPVRLPDGYNWLRSGGDSDRIAQPGLVGSGFEKQGILLLAMNPGGRAEGDSVEDHQFFEALDRLREADDRTAAFVEWNTVFCDVARTWKYYRNLISPILEKLHVQLADVAYLNVLKWRNRPEANGKRKALYDLCWESHTRSQVTVLNPIQIIVLGIGAGNWFTRVYGGPAAVHVIPRTRGDNYLSDRTRNAIDQLPDADAIGSKKQPPGLPAAV